MSDSTSPCSSVEVERRPARSTGAGIGAEQLLEIGLTPAEGRRLVESGSDVELLYRLVRAGCPSGLAYRIAL